MFGTLLSLLSQAMQFNSGSGSKTALILDQVPKGMIRNILETILFYFLIISACCVFCLVPYDKNAI